MDIRTTNEKVISESFGDLYIGKIGKKNIYCLRDICKSLHIYVKEGLGFLEKRGIQPIGVMVKRSALYKENKFVDYNGVLEILLASYKDIACDYKAWIDSVPNEKFKSCPIYHKTMVNRKKTSRRVVANKTKEVSSLIASYKPENAEVTSLTGMETFFKRYMSIEEFCWNLTSLSIVFTHEYCKNDPNRLYQASKLTDFIDGFKNYLKKNYKDTEIYNRRDEDWHWRERMKEGGLI